MEAIQVSRLNSEQSAASRQSPPLGLIHETCPSDSDLPGHNGSRHRLQGRSQQRQRDAGVLDGGYEKAPDLGAVDYATPILAGKVAGLDSGIRRTAITVLAEKNHSAGRGYVETLVVRHQL